MFRVFYFEASVYMEMGFDLVEKQNTREYIQ